MHTHYRKPFVQLLKSLPTPMYADWRLFIGDFFFRGVAVPCTFMPNPWLWYKVLIPWNSHGLVVGFLTEIHHVIAGELEKKMEVTEGECVLHNFLGAKNPCIKATLVAFWLWPGWRGGGPVVQIWFWKEYGWQSPHQADDSRVYLWIRSPRKLMGQPCKQKSSLHAMWLRLHHASHLT